MPSKKPAAELTPVVIESRIHVIRGHRVMLDEDLAELYGVLTKVLNQAVDRNRERFPTDFAFQLMPHEFTDLKSQIVTSSSGYGGRRKLPWVFTEQGVAMLSGVLRSPTAVRVNIEIMRAFVRLRQLLTTPGELVALVQRLGETVQVHDDRIKVILDVLRQMTAAPPARRIGFVQTDHAKNSPEAKK